MTMEKIPWIDAFVMRMTTLRTTPRKLVERAEQLWHGLAVLADSVDRKNVLAEIDPDVQNGHGLPLPSELTRLRHSHRGIQLLVAAMRLRV